MSRNIQTRNVLLSAGMVVFSFLILSISFSAVCYTSVIRERQQLLDSTANVVADVAAAVNDTLDTENWELSLQAASISRATGLHIFICEASGRVTICSDALVMCEHIGRTIPVEYLDIIADSDGFHRLTDLTGFYPEKRYVSAVPIRNHDGNLEGYVFAAAEISAVWQLWRRFTLMLLLTGCFTLLIAIPIAVISSRRETAPLKEMAEAARQFALGDLGVRVSLRGRSDEVAELCEAFNLMADALESSEVRRREFISSVSHELKTPMTTISGFADGLLDGTIPMDSAPKYLSIISSETKRLNRLVHQMLDISRMDKRESMNSSFDASEALRVSITNLYSRMEDKQLDLRPEIPEDPVLCRGSGDDVARVIYNILDNAVKFARNGTQLDVCLYKQNGKAFISVTDRGETIPEEELPMIFDRFHKSDRSRSLDRDGVGLGLFIVKTILDQMGEGIWVRSRDGETEFRFSLTIV
jgi:signal transduction histidine kinase